MNTTTITTYTITGNHAARIASRDGCTIRPDGSIRVAQTGWVGTEEQFVGCNVADYSRDGEYLGPDDDGMEPEWTDATDSAGEKYARIEETGTGDYALFVGRDIPGEASHGGAVCVGLFNSEDEARSYAILRGVEAERIL